MKSPTSVLKTVKALKLHGGTSLWVVNRRISQRSATYSVLRVEIDEKLKRKLKDIVAVAIAAADHASPYEYVSDDQDGQTFTLDANETDFAAIEADIDAANEDQVATNVSDLTGAWAYVARINTEDGNPIYAFRRVSTTWNTKRVSGVLGINSFFEAGVLVDLDEREVFRIDRKVDFFAHSGTAFIVDKRQFEIGMNFREGMERHRDEVLQEFTELALFTDVEVFRAVIGDNIRLLRRLASVRKNGYYRDSAFIDQLQRRAIDLGWPIEIVESKIVVNEENVEMVLRFINNDRLQSPINEEVFDVSVKRLVTS